MNKDRRNRISALVSELEDIAARIAELADEEQEAFDNMPESLQQSERGQQSEEAAGILNDARDAAEDLVSNLGSAVEL